MYLLFLIVNNMEERCILLGKQSGHAFTTVSEASVTCRSREAHLLDKPQWLGYPTREGRTNPGNHSVGPWDLWRETGRDEITGFCVGGSQLRGRVVGLRPLELHKF